MITVTNVSYNGVLQPEGYHEGDLFFTLNWNPSDFFVPYKVGIGGVQAAGWFISLPAIKLSEDVNIGTASYKCRVKISDDVVVLLNSLKKPFWKKMGFYVTAYLSSPKVGYAPGHLELPAMIDAAGVQLFNRPAAGSLWEAQTYLGFSFDDGSHIVPADANTIYCNDKYEERNLLNSPGSITNPLYSPLEAIQLASMISAYYKHPVTVNVQGGDYEIFKAYHVLRADCDVTVYGDTTDTPKIWVNEDMDMTQLFLGGYYVYQYNSVRTDPYQRWPIPCNTKLKIYDLDLTAIYFHGVAHTLDIQRCSVAKSFFGLNVNHDFTFLDNSCSATDFDVSVRFSDIPFAYIGGLSDYLYESPITCADPNWESSKFYHFKKFPVWDRATLQNKLPSDVIEQLDLLGFPYGTEQPSMKLINKYGKKWPRTGEYCPLDKLENCNAIYETYTTNGATGNFSSYETSYKIRRNMFRDNCTATFRAGLGRIYFTNNITTGNEFIVAGRRAIEVNNNTSDYVIKVVKYFIGDYDYSAEMPFPYPGSSIIQGKNFISLAALARLTEVTAFPIEIETAYNNIATVVRSSIVPGVSISSDEAYNYNFIKNFIGENFAYMGVVYTDSVAVSSNATEVDTDFNASFHLEHFYDENRLRPLPTSPYIDAGNPDPAYNDVDGSRNDQGHLGGPYADSAVVARIRWRDEYVSVNHTAVYAGMKVSLLGDRSSWSAASMPTFTWSADPGNPTTVTFTNNGTFEGANQEVTLDGVGTYRFTLTVSDGVNSDSETITFEVSPSRVFCVDPTITPTNNLLPSNKVADYVGSWEFYADSRLTSLGYTGGKIDALPYDGITSNSVCLSLAGKYNFTVPTPNERYYLKLKMADFLVNNGYQSSIKFNVVIMDSLGRMLFSDEARIENFDNLTRNNADYSIPYGVASAYFFVDSDPNLTIYIGAINVNNATQPPEVSYIDELYVTFADKEINTKYQDLRLAIRHSKPNDVVQVAGSPDGILVDVPIRVAGKKIACIIKGGYDANSYNVTTEKYDVRDVTTYKSILNYARFAYFKRQRDWAYNAISVNSYIYFPSEISGFYVINRTPDLTSAWGYDGIDVYAILHAPLTIKDIFFDGLYRAGTIRCISDSLLNINNDLTVENIDIKTCLHGLNVTTEHIDVNIRNITGNAVSAGLVVAECRSSPVHTRKLTIENVTGVDCGLFEDIADSQMTWNDPFYRKIPSLADKQNFIPNVYYASTYTPYRYAKRDVKQGILVIYCREAWTREFADIEISGCNFSSTREIETLSSIVFDGYRVPASRILIHDNTDTSSADFISLMCGGCRSDWYNPGEPHFHSLVYKDTNHSVVFNAYTNITDLIAATTDVRPMFVVYNNNITNMRSIVNMRRSSAFYEGEEGGQGTVVVIRDNNCTNVEFAMVCGPRSAVTPQLWDRIKHWFNLENNGVGSEFPFIFWNIYPDHPELEELIHMKVMKYGVLPERLLKNIIAGG